MFLSASEEISANATINHTRNIEAHDAFFLFFVARALLRAASRLIATLALKRFEIAGTSYPPSAQFNIHCTPNRSVSIPNRAPHGTSLSGRITFPLSLTAPNNCSISAIDSQSTDTEKFVPALRAPLGHPSDAISSGRPSRASWLCMIFAPGSLDGFPLLSGIAAN
jgi:hypothetical protein